MIRNILYPFFFVQAGVEMACDAVRQRLFRSTRDRYNLIWQTVVGDAIRDSSDIRALRADIADLRTEIADLRAASHRQVVSSSV